MKRYYYVNDNLDELEQVEQELEHKGISTPRIHVLSRDDAGVHGHRLNEVNAFLRQDLMRSGKRGALIGIALALLVIGIAWLSGFSERIGWVPFVCLSIVLLGFFTWEGGLWGIQEPNSRFRRFERALNDGQHLLLVDVDGRHEETVRHTLAQHPSVKPAGVGVATPAWVVGCHERWRDFVKWAP